MPRGRTCASWSRCSPRAGSVRISRTAIRWSAASRRCARWPSAACAARPSSSRADRALLAHVDLALQYSARHRVGGRGLHDLDDLPREELLVRAVDDAVELRRIVGELAVAIVGAA